MKSSAYSSYLRLILTGLCLIALLCSCSGGKRQVATPPSSLGVCEFTPYKKQAEVKRTVTAPAPSTPIWK